MIPVIQCTQNNQNPKDRKQNGGCQWLWGKEGMGTYWLVNTVLALQDEKNSRDG